MIEEILLLIVNILFNKNDDSQVCANITAQCTINYLLFIK